MKSLICQFIEVHPYDWVELLQEKNIKIHYNDELDLHIFNYGIAADFSDPIVQEARGIIIHIENVVLGHVPSLGCIASVVAWPFRKFGNSHESYADSIDWDSARVEEKIDGSILKLYYYCDSWHWATNGCIDAKNATLPNSDRTFLDLIHCAINYKDIQFDQLNTHHTYIFEIVSPENQVVVQYDYPYLYHIGERDIVTGQEVRPSDIGIEHVRQYDIDDVNLEKVIQKANSLNEDGTCTHEGFVVVDKDFHRVKIKSPRYLEFHYSLTRGKVAKADVVEAILYNDEEKIAAIKSYPRFIVDFKYYDWQVTKFIYEVDQFVKMCRDIYTGDRKSFALAIKDSPYADCGFKAIDYPQYTSYEILTQLISLNSIVRRIPDVP